MPGRSAATSWPEPQQIRDIQQGEKPGSEGFPRGALGLPIVFHFKDRGEPPDHTLNGKDPHGRMASPVILRPFAISKEQALPLVMVLNAPTGDLYLHGGETPVEVGFGHRKAIQELIGRAQDRWNATPVRI